MNFRSPSRTGDPRSLRGAAALLLSSALTLLAQAGETHGLVLTGRGLEPVAKGYCDDRASRGLNFEVLALASLELGPDPLRSIQGALRERWAAAGRPERFFITILGDAPSPSEAADAPFRVPFGRRPDRSEQTAAAGRKDADIATDCVFALADDSDELPDFCVGRLPARSLEEGQALLARIRAQEDSVKPGPWQRRLSFFASEGRFGVGDRILEQLFRKLADDLIPYQFDLDMTYGRPASPYCPPPDEISATMRQRINDGALMLNYVGHGHDFSLDTLRWQDRRYPICSEKDLLALNTGGRLPIFLIIACDTGRFDRADGRDCLAESMLKSKGGPGVVIASSRVSHPYPNAILQKELIEALTLGAQPSVGELFRDASRAMLSRRDEPMRRRLDLIARLIVPPEEREELLRSHIAMYNLIGDPALQIPRPERLELTRRGSSLKLALPEDFNGQAEVTLESERSLMLRPVLEAWPEAGLDTAQRLAIRQSYRDANDKVLRRWLCPVVKGELQGPASWDWSLPAIPGSYVIKVFAEGESQGAIKVYAGQAPLGKVPSSRSRAWLPAGPAPTIRPASSSDAAVKPRLF
jgi:hypothetical protein